MTILFTSDQHFSHQNIIKYCNRPYPDIYTMNADIIQRYNSVVKDDDTVYHLGDFALDERVTSKILPMLKGVKHLIVGNHDRCHPRRTRWKTFADRYMQWGFKSVMLELDLDEFHICHFPYVGDSKHEARYPEWRPENKGKWLLHGHVHDAWDIKDKMFNVGVDVRGFAPISLEEIRILCKGK